MHFFADVVGELGAQASDPPVSDGYDEDGAVRRPVILAVAECAVEAELCVRFGEIDISCFVPAHSFQAKEIGYDLEEIPVGFVSFFVKNQLDPPSSSSNQIRMGPLATVSFSTSFRTSATGITRRPALCFWSYIPCSGNVGLSWTVLSCLWVSIALVFEVIVWCSTRRCSAGKLFACCRLSLLIWRQASATTLFTSPKNHYLVSLPHLARVALACLCIS